MRAPSSNQEPSNTVIDAKKSSLSGNNKVSLFARSSTVSASFGYNLYNMPIIKNLCMEDYNLLNIKHSKERPYFFGLGIPTRFNCNQGFHKKIKSKHVDSNQHDLYGNKSHSKDAPLKIQKKSDMMRATHSSHGSGNKHLRPAGHSSISGAVSTNLDNR